VKQERLDELRMALDDKSKSLDNESKRAETAEEGLKNLEKTFAVRQARRLGLIKVEQLGFVRDSSPEKEGVCDKSP